jgi:hypothetical protein
VPFATVEALDDIRAGTFVVVVDAPGRATNHNKLGHRLHHQDLRLDEHAG